MNDNDSKNIYIYTRILYIIWIHYLSSASLFLQKSNRDFFFSWLFLGEERSQVMGNPVEIREWNLQGLPADVWGTKFGQVMAVKRNWLMIS